MRAVFHILKNIIVLTHSSYHRYSGQTQCKYWTENILSYSWCGVQ